LTSYPGFHAQPMTWRQVLAKYERLSAPFVPSSLQREIAGVVETLESQPIEVLARLLGAVHRPVPSRYEGEHPWQTSPGSAHLDS
jgi:2-methylcitrate dehydratase